MHWCRKEAIYTLNLLLMFTGRRKSATVMKSVHPLTSTENKHHLPVYFYSLLSTSLLTLFTPSVIQGPPQRLLYWLKIRTHFKNRTQPHHFYTRGTLNITFRSQGTRCKIHNLCSMKRMAYRQLQKDNWSHVTGSAKWRCPWNCAGTIR